MEKITIENPRNIESPDSDKDAISCEVANLSQVSDGYHTIAELYDHRITLFIALCRVLNCPSEKDHYITQIEVWRSKYHSDGELAFGGEWFVLGIDKDEGEQITYHLPISRWDETEFAETLDRAPEWDGHTSADVIERLKLL
jgi:hypothetical protein